MPKKIPTEPFCIHLHSCKADNHHHLISSDENISWPFWSSDAGLKMVDFSLNLMKKNWDISPKEMDRLHQEAEHIRLKILYLSRIQNVDSSGRFVKGFKMPHEMGDYEVNIADSWGAFRRGEVPYMAYFTQHMIGDFAFPLYCDFVARKTERPEESLGKYELAKLANEPAKIITMAELGIKLKIAA